MAKLPELKVDVMGLDEVKALVEGNKRLRAALESILVIAAHNHDHDALRIAKAAKEALGFGDE